MEFSVRADVSGVLKTFRQLKARSIGNAAARAINDTIVTVRKEGAQMVKQEHPALKIGDIKREMVTKKARARYLRGSVTITGKALSLKRYRARETKRGVTARMGKGRQQLVYYQGRRAFVIQPYGDEVFVRRFPKGRQVRRLRGPSMPGVFNAQRQRFEAIMRKRWPIAFRSRIQYEIQKATRR